MAMYPCLSLPSLSFPSVSGAVCSFDSQYAGLPLKSHKIALTATQSGSGTPSPSNPRALNGWSAINISASSKNLVSWEHLNLHGWGGSDSTLVRQLNHLSEGTYTVQYKIKVVTLQSGYTDGNYGLLLRAVDNGVNFNITMRENKTNVSEGDIFTYTATFTLPSNYVGKFTSAYYYTGRSPSNSSDYCDFYDFQIEKGTTATAYEQPTDFYISIGSTVYGGEYDARTGVLTVTRIYIKPASTATISSFSHTANNTWIFVIQGFSAVTRGEAISNINIVDTYGNTTGNGFCKATTNYPVFSLNDADNNLNASSSAADIRTAFANFVNTYSPEAVYELATPTTIQLPPCPIDTLEGVNNIWADTGDTTLQYIKLG